MLCCIAYRSFKFVQTKVPGTKMASRRVVLGLNYRNTVNSLYNGIRYNNKFNITSIRSAQESTYCVVFY